MPNFNSLKSFWDRLSANWTPFAHANLPYLIPYYEDIRAHEDTSQLLDPSPIQLPHEHSTAPHSHLHRDTSKRPAFHAHRDKFNMQKQLHRSVFTPALVENVQVYKRAETATSSPPNEQHQPNPTFSPEPIPSVSTTTTLQATMARKRSTSGSSSGSSSSSSSNNSTHHARAALEAIHRIHSTRNARHTTHSPPSTSPPATARASSKPTQHNNSSHTYPPTAETTPPSESSSPHPLPHLAHPPHERTPLLPAPSPVVSPLGPSTCFLSPRSAQPPEPFPDLEPGLGSPLDSSYDGVDVFGTHVSRRRRWDLGESEGENRRVEVWDGCLLGSFFVGFVVVIVGGGMVLVWALLHQS